MLKWEIGYLAFNDYIGGLIVLLFYMIYLDEITRDIR